MKTYPVSPFRRTTDEIVAFEADRLLDKRVVADDDLTPDRPPLEPRVSAIDAVSHVFVLDGGATWNQTVSIQ